MQPPLAYGDLGRKPDIPGDSRITYLFGLLHFEKQKEMAEMTWAQVHIRMTHQQRLDNHDDVNLIFVADYVVEEILSCGDFWSWRKLTNMRYAMSGIMRKMMMMAGGSLG